MRGVPQSGGGAPGGGAGGGGGGGAPGGEAGGGGAGGGRGAAPESEPDGRQRKVLRDVTRIEVDIPVGPLAVFPLRAGEDGRPDEDGGGLGAELLEQRRACEVPAEIPSGHLLEPVPPDAARVHPR